jgi:putative ABC transport system permease protein
MLVSFTAVVATSVKASIQLTYRESITADYVVESARNEMLGGLPESVHHHIATLTEVAVASRLRYGHWKDGQHTRALTAVDPVTLPRVTSLRMRAGSLDGLRTGGVVLAERVAAQRGLSVGDTLAMTFSRTGDQLLTVVGLLRDRDAQALSTDYIVGLDTYARNYAEDVDASIFVRLAAGVGTVDARRAIEAAIAEAPTAQVRDQAAAVAGRSQTIERILGLVTALLLVSIVIALLGITNTLALSIVERTRQIGLLRAVGMTRGQLRTMVVGEAVLVSGIATVVGVGTGVALGAGTARILGAAAEAPVVLPGVQLALVAVIAVGAGLLAGMLPARRAARLDLLTAVNHAG